MPWPELASLSRSALNHLGSLFGERLGFVGIDVLVVIARTANPPFGSLRIACTSPPPLRSCRSHHCNDLLVSHVRPLSIRFLLAANFLADDLRAPSVERVELHLRDHARQRLHAAVRARA